MKKQLFLSFIMALALSSCYKTTETTSKRLVKIPIYEYTTETEAEAGLKQGSPKQLTTFGNIYVYQQYLLINERGQGVHIFDNSNPSSPQKISFMNIPGNYDMAIKNNVLYADSYDDLLSLDISDVNNISLIERKNNVFPDKHPNLFGVIVGYRDTTIISTYTNNNGNGLFFNDRNDDFASLESTSVQTFNSNVNVTGTGGSFSRFTLANNFLYTIDSHSMTSFDVSDDRNMIKTKSEFLNIAGEVETLFPYQNSLFVGTTVGVYIYDISTPSDFNFTSQFTHARACDPVYVEDDVAFITLRSDNNACRGINNQLDILDVADLNIPNLVNTYQMTNPHGVGVDDSLLFICEADAGLKIFDLKKDFFNNKLTHVNINQIKHEASIYAYDVIPNNGILIVVGEEDLHQYDYSDPSNITLLSRIQ